MKFETNYSRARTIRGRELIQGRGSRCANYSRARTNRGRKLFGLLGYVILNLALVPGKIFNSRGRDVFCLLIPIVGEELQAKKVLAYIWHFLYTL